MGLSKKTFTRENVADYYGRVLSSKKDLKTSACCTNQKPSVYIREPLKLIDDEIQNKYYGCGSPIPLALKGLKILDLGCGTGRDCFILSYYAGEEGEVVGVDMLDEQLDVARKHLQPQMSRFGFKAPNARFVKGYMEDLRQIGLPDGYFDIVTSNCVVNLSYDKEAVLKEVFRVLKEGGEFFFSDVFSDRRLPDWAHQDPLLLGECLGGALYWKDFERLARRVGFVDPRLFSSARLDLYEKAVIDKIGFAQFCSITYRLFKFSGLEDACEDYGQIARYKGSIPFSPHAFKLDGHHSFKKDKPELVCGNTASMIQETRFANHFEIVGDRSTHYGLFAGCGASLPQKTSTAEDRSPGGCC